MRRRRLGRAAGVFLLSAALVPVMVTGTVLASFLFVPLPATLPRAKGGVASRISHVYDIRGREIALFREFETDIPVSKADIPLHLKQAVVAAEDQRFYSHGGVDIYATFRALWADIRGRRYAQGGSTITQQYVKNAFIGRERTIVRKIREAILASQLDRQEPKEEILYRYLRTIYLGGGAYGVGAASQTFFRKQVKDLTLAESALLAGLIPAPTTYDPRANAVGAEQRRVLVLGQMLQQGRITQADHDAALPFKVVNVTSKGPPPPGPATLIYPPEQQQTAHPYFVDYLRRYLTAKYGPEKVFRGGLRIQSTLDVDLQALADKAVADALRGTAPPLEMSLVSVEPPTGFVKALVGGRDFAASQVNLALGDCPKPVVEAESPDGPSCMDGGGTGRQPGSAFKPFVLAKAFEEGLSPSKVYPAPSSFRVPGCAGDQCTIRNVEGQGYGSATLRTATVQSINTVYAQLQRDVGIKETAELAHRLGLTMVGPNGKDARGRTYGLSLALGAQETSPLDMAGAYAVFAARGMQARPTPVVKIIDATGAVLEDNTKPQSKRVLNEVVADNVTDILKGVIAGGTGKSADIGRPAAGKTGTSENFGNAWFCGFTPTLSTSVWIGYSDAPRPLRGIRGVGRVYGGTIPAQTWHNYMAAALKDVRVTEFNEPAPIQPIADELKRLARGGIDVGNQRRPSESPTGGPYLVTPQPPAPQAPLEATTTTVYDPYATLAPTTTTTTRRRPLFP